MTLTVGDESPLPGGLEKGDGNLFPETPCTKCGTAFAKKVPAKKLAMYRYHDMTASYHQSTYYKISELSFNCKRFLFLPLFFAVNSIYNFIDELIVVLPYQIARNVNLANLLYDIFFKIINEYFNSISGVANRPFVESHRLSVRRNVS